MADRMQVSQAGISVAAEADADRQRVSQAGISVANAEIVDYLHVSQAGVSVAVCSLHSLSAVPADFAATRSGSSVTCTWTPAPTATAYRLERTVDGITWGIVAILGATASTYTDTPVPLGAIVYRLRQYEGLCEYLTAESAVGPLPPPVAPNTLQGRFRIRFRNAAGALIGELGYAHQEEADRSGIEWLRYYKHIYGAGFAEFRVTGNLAFLSAFDENGQVEVWRQVGDTAWAIDFISINVGDYERSWPDGIERFHYRGPGTRDILARAQVNYAAGVANRSAFAAQPAETIMTTLVRYNATAAATTADGRLVDFVTPFAVELAPDQARGTRRDWFCFQDNLLDSLGRLARVGGGDFTFERDPLNVGDYTRFRFGFAPGQLGTDRRATVRFSLALGNLTAPRVRNVALGAPTVATVGGPGDELDREFTVALAENYASARHRETFLNATDAQTVAGRTARAQAYLEQQRARETFEWQALQTGSSRYGEHYNLGDLVTVIRPDTGAASTHKITGVSVSLSAGGSENVTLDTEQQP